MTLRRGDPVDLFRQFLDEGSTSPRPAGGYTPPTDIFTTEGKVVVRMDVAGVKPEDVEVTCQGNTLVVNGRRDFPYEGEDARFLSRGIFYGEFTQRVELGERLDTSKVGARYADGVLEVTIPFAEQAQPRSIQIQTG